MANISDSAGIFVGGTLELFNEMQRLIGRDGDVAAAQEQLQDAMKKVCASQQLSASGTGNAKGRRKA